MQNKKPMIIVLVLALVCVFLAPFSSITAKAGNDNILQYDNPTTGYKAIIEDNANLLNDSEKEKLLGEMESITAYGNAMFHTINDNSTTADAYASSYFHGKFGTNSGVLFLIDMDNRKVFIFSDGDIYKTVTKTYANIITDNIYTYATKQEYYNCASKVFYQVNALLEGRRIAKPMKYISNILLAIVIALIINYISVRFYASAAKPARREILNSIFVNKEFKNANATFTRETKRYDPIETGSSGGGGSFGGGGGGGGGGSSGGGGGHSF